MYYDELPPWTNKPRVVVWTEAMTLATRTTWTWTLCRPGSSHLGSLPQYVPHLRGHTHQSLECHCQDLVVTSVFKRLIDRDIVIVIVFN